jgi:hypothetical protein
VKTFVIALLLSMCLSCAGPTDIAGRYEARHEGLSGPVDVVMLLGEDGAGKWEIGGEVLNFLWTPHEDGVRVHTRDGAVLDGARAGRNLRLDVPGVGKLLFERK